MSSFARERMHDLWPELEPLIREHWLEVAHYLDIPLDPDRDAYNAMEDAGAVRAYTARIKGVLVGYVIYFVRPNLHYSGSKQAVQDVLFIAPEHRGGLGFRLLRWSHERLRDEGVQVVYQHVKVKPGLNFGPVLERMGYELIDNIYGKRLDKWEFPQQSPSRRR